MADNPSYFVSDERPVENVTFPEVELFLSRLDARVPGLALRLPTEAEWEYGCRADTTTETYAGEVQALSMYNAPVLSDIAWYGGNSGMDFELDNGLDSSYLPDKQYPGAVSGTHSVKQKQPNRWGIYDCLGNLWEWCQDWQADYEAAPSVDPAGPETGEYRVIRGGAWSDTAEDMRVANRNQASPLDKTMLHGFRLARGNDGSR